MIPCSQEMLFHNSQFKIRLRERWGLTNSCTAHAWGDIPWNLNLFKRSTERKNILFHVLSKRQQKAQRWRKDVVQNSEFLAYMFIYEMLLVYINCFHSGQRNRKLEFQFWIKTRCNRKASTAFCEVWLCLIFFIAVLFGLSRQTKNVCLLQIVNFWDSREIYCSALIFLSVLPLLGQSFILYFFGLWKYSWLRLRIFLFFSLGDQWSELSNMTFYFWEKFCIFNPGYIAMEV